MIDQFDPNDEVLLKNMSDILNQHPNFQLLKVLYLKSIKSQNSKEFDKVLSHTSISTYDRELLYEFLDTDIFTNKVKEEQIHYKEKENTIKEKMLKNDSIEDKNTPKSKPEKMKFSKWFSYINGNKTLQEYNEVEKNLIL